MRFENPDCLAKLVELAWEPAAAVSPDGRILFVNRALCRLLDTEATSLVQHRCIEFLKAPENPEDMRNAMERLQGGGTWQGTLDISCNLETSLSCGVRLRPVFFTQPDSCIELAYLAFISNEGNADSPESRLEMIHGAVARANLAGGVAHHFNNLLATIILQAELVRFREQPFEKTKEAMDKIIRVSQTGSDTLRQFQESRSQSEGSRSVFALNGPTQQRLKLLKDLAPSGVHLSWDIPEDELTVHGYESDIHTILTNLVLNAWEAFPDRRGSVRVSLKGIKKFAAAVGPGRRIIRPGNDLVMIEVTDTGPGIPPELEDQITEPFITSKNPADHVGMGLSTVNGILNKSHGWMEWISPFDGGGCCFRVFLPFAARDSLQNRHQQLKLQNNVGRILLVDDETLILQAGQSLLTDLGFSVETATDPKVGLSLARWADKPFDLVLTDYNMPGMTGIELSRALRDDGFPGKIILTTGMLQGLSQDEMESCGIDRILLKPCSVLDLASAIQQMLATSGHAA